MENQTSSSTPESGRQDRDYNLRREGSMSPLPTPDQVPASLWKPTDTRDIWTTQNTTPTNWVIWRYQERNGKMTKIPLYVSGVGRNNGFLNAKSNDKSTWLTLDAALTHAHRGRREDRAEYGIGIMLGDGLVGIDIDHAYDDAGQLLPWVAELVQRMGSYAEKSPSGRGIHILLRCSTPLYSRRNKQIEFYSKDRFFTFTGDKITHSPFDVTDCTFTLAKWHVEEFPPSKATVALEHAITAPTITYDPSDFEVGVLEELTTAASLPPSYTLTPERMPDYWAWQDRMAKDLCLHLSNDPAKFQRLWNGDKSDFAGDWSACDMALCSVLMWACSGYRDQVDRLFRQSGLMRLKWERQDYREKFTLQKAWEGYIIREAENRQRAMEAFGLVKREVFYDF